MIRPRCNVINAFPSTRRFAGGSETRPPLRRRRSARITVVLVWTVFWFNTVLFPCCEALAAAFSDHISDHTEEVSQLASAVPQAHFSGETHSERPHHAPDAPCDTTVNAGPAINGEYAGLPANCVQLEEVVINEPFAVGLMAMNHAAIRASRDYHPPPRSRLYLQTQRLLI